MAVAKKSEDEISHSSPSSSSLNEALLVSTMCIIGLQVHVHIEDGSIYSGIFYTISLDNEFGIVLKNAKITKKGTSKSNVAAGKIVETLVILSSNIVQIFAEGVSVPSNVAANFVSENVVSAMADFPSDPRSCVANKSVKSGIDRRGGSNHTRNSAKLESRLENKVGTLTAGKDQEPRGLPSSCTQDAMKEPLRRDENKRHPSRVNHQRQTGARNVKSSKQNPDVHQEDNVDAQRSRFSLGNTTERVKPRQQEIIMPEPSSNGHHEAAARPPSTETSSSHSTSLDQQSERWHSISLDQQSERCQGLVASTNKLLPMQATDPVKKAKEFKLNPGAKTFSPALTKRLSSTDGGMTPVVPNIGYVPSNTPMLHVPEVVQPEIGINPFLSHASSPSKFVPYTNLAAGNAVSGSHFPQHMVGIGPTINMGQPHRFPSQYHSVQATPMLVNPNPQVMVGRSGQLMYMQPISPDLAQGAPHVPSRPIFPPQQLQYPKHQNLIAAGQPMQLYAPQPYAANGHQPYAVMPPDIPLMQPPPPFPTNRSIMQIPVPNGFYGTKFL